MLKITQEAISAFMNYEKFYKDNTSTIVHTDFTGLYIHGNLIAKHYSYDECIKKESQGKIMITSAGWNSNTTKARLRAIPGVSSLVTRKGKLFLNGKEWDGEWTTL